MDTDGRSSFGYEEGAVAALCYFLGLGFLVYFMEQKSHFVRFHALQSILGYSIIGGIWLCMKMTPALQLFTFIPSFMAITFTVLMMYRAHYGDEYQLPLIGSIAHRAVFDADNCETEEESAGEAESESKGK